MFLKDRQLLWKGRRDVTSFLQKYQNFAKLIRKSYLFEILSKLVKT